MHIRKSLKVSFKLFTNSLGGAGQAAGGSSGKQGETFSKMKEQMGMFAGRPMTRDEAMQILNVGGGEEVEPDAELDPKEIMERFETLIEKNQLEKGGSFYLQSKIYWAKQALMEDFPAEENLSKWNPVGAGHRACDKEEEK